MLESEKEAFARKDISWETKFRAMVAAVVMSSDFFVYKLKTTINPKHTYLGKDPNTMWVFEFSHKLDRSTIRIQTRIGFEKALYKLLGYVDKWEPTVAVEVDCKEF